MPKNHDIITIEVALKNETEKAYCVRAINAGMKDAWVPKSQCELGQALEGSQVRELQPPEWMALEKGLV